MSGSLGRALIEHTGGGLVPLQKLIHRSSRRRSGERGASMVEMAMVLPLFLILIYGIIEFSFAFAQNNELRAMAREGARIAAVESISSQAVTNQLCPKIRLLDPATFGFKVDGATAHLATPAGSKGSVGEVYAEANVRTLTGFFDGALDGILLTSTVRFYVERPTDAPAAWWGPTGTPLSCP